jgi:HK97 family phage major capsid protein
MAASVRIKQIRQAQAEAKAKITGIIGACATENRSQTDDEKATIKAQETALDGLTEELVVVTRQAERERADASAAADVQAAAAGVTIVGDTPTRVDIGADRALDPKRPGLFGLQLHAVRASALAGKGGEPVTDEQRRLLAPMMASGQGLNTDVPSEGGFLVGQERTTTILQRSYSQGQILSRVRRQPIGAGSNGIKFPAIDETSRADSSRFGGIVSGWLGQGNTLSAGKPKFREMDLKLRKVGAFVYSTDEMLVDAIALEGWVDTYLPLELTFRTEDSVLSGVGGNQPLGVYNGGSILSLTRTSAGRVLYEDVKAMWHRMWAPSRLNAVWLVDQSVETDLEVLQVPIGTGGVLAPIYKPAGTVPGQQFATLYGRPVVPVEYCAALGTTGDIGLYDFGEYTLIDKGNVQQAVSLHVAFLTDEAVYRFIYRVDGQPSWNAPLTPKSGGATLAPFIKLTT